MNEIKLFDAIEKMKNLSKEDNFFSFTFLSCDLSRQKSDGVIEVKNATLTKRNTKEQNVNAEIMLNYYDHNLKENRRFYQPLLMFFNGQKVILN